jgi:hypothetical protein
LTSSIDSATDTGKYKKPSGRERRSAAPFGQNKRPRSSAALFFCFRQNFLGATEGNLLAGGA